MFVFAIENTGGLLIPSLVHFFREESMRGAFGPFDLPFAIGISEAFIGRAPVFGTARGRTKAKRGDQTEHH